MALFKMKYVSSKKLNAYILNKVREKRLPLNSQ